MPFNLLLNKDDGTLKSDTELTQLFEEQGIQIGKTTVNTCGSGVTACVVDLAMSLLGHEKGILYDGSWSEYGAIPEPKL